MTNLPILDVQVKIKPIFEVRQRFERRTNRDFLSNASDNRSDLFGRYRAGFSFKDKDLSGRFIYQYAHQLAWTAPLNYSDERSDVIEAFGTVDVDGAKVTLGRQRVSIGGQRLIGELGWNNVSNSFDGVMLEKGNLSAFAVKQGVGPVPDRNLFLAGVSQKDSKGVSLAVFKTDKLFGVQKGRLTLSREGKVKAQNGAFDYQVAGQLGHEAGKSVAAWAAYGRYTAPLAPKAEGFVETNLASGGRSADRVSTFDQLYPAGHDKLGLMDTTGWQNIVQVGVGLRFNASTKDSFKVQLMDMSLFDKGDSWYGVGGGPNPRAGGNYTDPTGSSGRHLGREFDLDWTHKYDQLTTFSAGFGVFWPGTFPGTLQVGNSTHQVWGYLSINRKF